MKKTLFFFIFLLSCHSALAQDTNLFFGQTKEEAKLLTELSLRRQELDKKADSLYKQEKELTKKEKTQQQSTEVFAHSLPRNVQIYMNMKPSKAASLLDKKPIFEAKHILDQMPAVYAARILNQMDETKAVLLIDKSTDIKD